MQSSGSESDSGWNKELITAVSKKQGKGRKFSEQQRCGQIQECLDQGADIDTVDGNGNTALHVAVKRGYQLIVQFLLRAGAKVDIFNCEGHTAMRLAENLGEQEIANYLKNSMNLAIRRSTGPCDGFLSIADNQRPSTSRESASMSENSSQWRNSDNQSRKFESVAKNSSPKRTGDAENGGFAKRLRKLTLSDVPHLQMHHDAGVESDSGGKSSKRKRQFDYDHRKVHSTPRLEYMETYEGSGLKLSLHGMVYQLKHLMLILHRAWRMGYTFRLATEMDAAEKFDDVVLHYLNDKGDEVHRFIQVKHKQDGTKSIGARHLLDMNDGEFGMLKYFVSWRKIKRHPDFGGKGPKTFILCTNIGLDLVGLKEANINVRKIEEPDDFLRVTNRDRQPPRYKILVDKRSGLYDTLELASDVHRLARVLAERICDSQDIHLNTDILKSYHVALAKEVVNVSAKRLSVKFIRNDGLSKKAVEFRKIFFLNTKRLLSKKLASEKDIWEFLEQTSLKLSSTFGKKSQTPNKSELTQFTELPEDYISDKEMFDFLNEFVLAVDQPNETELGEMIKQEIGAESQFNLLDAGLLRDSFQNVILDWFKEKQGKFLKNEDAEDFFREMEVKLGSLITMALSFEHSEKLKTLGIEFDCEHTELLNFLNSPDATSNRTLELISFEQTLLTALRVYQTLTQLQNSEKYGSFIFVRLETLLLPRIMEQVLRAFEWPHNHDLLVIDCESIRLMQYSQAIWIPLCQIMSTDIHKRLILITQTCNDLAPQLNLRHQTYHEKNGSYSFRTLTVHSRKKLLRKAITKFQGVSTETSLEELLGIRDFANLAANELDDLSEIINSHTLVELIYRNEIEIGSDLEGVGEISNYFIDRRVRRHVVIRADILEDLKFPGLLAVSGIEPEYPGKLLRTGEIPPMARNPITRMAPNYCIDRNIQDKFPLMGENLQTNENPTSFNILDNAQEEKQFKDLCAKNAESNVHWLTKNSGKFIWNKSQGDIAYLLQYRDSRESANNDDPAATKHLSTDQLAARGEPVIISDKAGMGKSVLLTYLARKMKETEPDMLVLKIDLNFNATALAEVKKKSSYDLADFNGAVQFLVNDLLDHETTLARKVFKAMIKKQRRVALIFDGFDEISPTHEDTVIQLLETLASHGIKKMFCGTRPHTREELESKLNSFSYELQPLSASDQEVFLTKFWKSRLGSYTDSGKRTGKRIKKYARGIMQKLATSIDDRKHELTGIPLQAKLVAEIFGYPSEGKRKNFDYCREFINSRAKQPKFPEKIDLIHLYELFVNKKFDIFFNKTGGNLENEAAKEFRKLSYDKFMDTHKKLALRVLFDEDKIKELLLSEEDAIDIVYERTGIITQFIDGRPLFGHRSYAEYFAAKFISAMLKKGVQNESIRRIIVADVLLGGNYGNVRAFVNFLLSDEHNITVEIESWKYYVNEDRSELNETIFHIAAKEGNDRIIRLFMNCVITDPEDRKAIVNVKDSNGRTAVHGAVEHGRMDGIKLLLEDTNFEINTHDLKGTTPLHLAAQEGQLDVVKYLIDKGADVNSQENRSWTALHAAAFSGASDLVEYLLDKNANVHSQETRGWTPLHVAAGEDKLEAAKCLIEHGANVNSQANDGPSPLHIAAYSGRLEVSKYLLDKGANVNCKENDGRTPLHTAAYTGRLEMVKCLLENDADVNSQENRGWMPVHIAAQEGKLDVVKYLLDNGADVDCQENDLWTSMHIAAQEGRLDIVKYLLEEGADVNAQENSGRTPLLIAAQQGNLDVVKYLLENGADVHSQESHARTPLHIAAYSGSSEVAKYLLENGADVTLRENDGCTPLYAAAYSGKLELVQYLLDNGSDVNSEENRGWTPVHVAALQGNADVVKYLLDNGANFSHTEIDGRTPLHIAAYTDKLEAVEHLLDKGADVNVQDNCRWTPLHIAAQEGQLQVVEHFLDKGANVNSQEDRGWTALHLAVQQGHMDVVKSLLDNGATVNSQENRGWTPLHIAVQEGELTLIKYLLDAGANVNSQHNHGCTPLYAAAHSGRLDVVKYLLDAGADLNSQENNRCMPLYAAAHSGRLDVVEYLVDRGANINSQEVDGSTPLYAAAHSGRSDVVRYLLDNGANVDCQQNRGWAPLHVASREGQLDTVKYLLEKKANIDLQESRGWTPLHLASRTGKLDVVKHLLNCGANVSAQDNDQDTPLHLAAFAGQLEVVKHLLDKQANADSKSMDGETPLHAAAVNGKLHVVKYLLSRGAHALSRDNDGKTPLDLAADADKFDVVDYLRDIMSSDNNFQ